MSARQEQTRQASSKLPGGSGDYKPHPTPL
jgi:hypothetical protein